MQLTEEQILANYELHRRIIEKYLPEERQKAVLKMIESIGEEDYATAPASGKNWYHGAYPGGYIVHVNMVVRNALMQMKLYKQIGGTIDFTEEELVFAALFHDLGKVGNGEKPNYVPNDSEWHVKNQGLLYKSNPEIDFMLIPDRSLYLLQKYGIKVSQQEYLAIKLHDGIFDEANKSYFISYSPDSKFKTNIVPILHVADYLASRAELDMEKSENQ